MRAYDALACEEISHPLFCQLTGVPVCSPDIFLKKLWDLAQTSSHSCLKPAGQHGLPEAPPWGAQSQQAGQDTADQRRGWKRLQEIDCSTLLAGMGQTHQQLGSWFEM